MRFSLKTLLVVVGLCGVVMCGLMARNEFDKIWDKVNRQSRCIWALERMAHVRANYETNSPDGVIWFTFYNTQGQEVGNVKSWVRNGQVDYRYVGVTNGFIDPPGEKRMRLSNPAGGDGEAELEAHWKE